MVTRSHTEVFVLMRNNAVHSRQIFGEQSWSENARLVDVERGEGSGSQSGPVLAPPPWKDSLEDAQCAFVRLRRKLDDLRSAHARHLQRPTLDDGSEEDRQVARIVTEIRRHITTIQRILRDIDAYTRQGKPKEREVASNVLDSLVSTLQEICVSFRDAQMSYLKSLSSREERSNNFLDLPNFEELSLEDPHTGLTNRETDMMFTFGATSLEDVEPRPLNQKQLLAFEEENTKVVEEREKQVNEIVKSIVDLNDIFKDLAHMVSEQGTVLDRIDYNIENTQIQVHDGLQQLKKAETYQKKNRKMHCILVLSITIIILILVLIIIKA